MRNENGQDTVARRTFLSRLSAAVAAFAAVSANVDAAQGQSPAAAPAPPAAPPSTPGGYQPARHPEDDWFDQTPAKHRLFFDTTTPAALTMGVAFARNFFEANATGYKLTDADLAQIICLRHHATSFAFNDAMWAKYGAALAEAASYTDPAGKPLTANPFDPGTRGAGVSALAKRGVRYAVCQMASRRVATAVAGKTGGKVDEVYQELTENMIPNARLVPAGIVAVNRAQERGYTATSVVG